MSILPPVLGKIYEADPELGVVRQEREPRDLETQKRLELQFSRWKQVRMEWTDGAMGLSVCRGTDVVITGKSMLC